MKSSWFAMLLLSFVLPGCVMEVPADEPLSKDSPGADDNDEEPIGEAEQPLRYTCRIDTQWPWDSCTGGPVEITSASGEHYRARIDMNWNASSRPHRRVDVFAWICNPSGFSLHLSDSPTGNGVSDDGTTDHQAQAYVFDDDFHLMGTTGTSNIVPGAVGLTCETVHFTSYQSVQPTSPCSSRFAASGNELWYGPANRNDLHCLSYSACAGPGDPGRGTSCDWEDRWLSDRDYLYLGLNRSVSSSAQSLGTGLLRACIVLNDEDIEPANCLDPWPVPQ